MEKEYTISYKDKDGRLDEVSLNAAVLQEAKSKAMWYIKNGVAVEDITIKLFDEGDLRHQWDWKNDKWLQYE